MIEIYLLLCISFSIMYAVRYTREIVISVQKACIIFEVNPNDHFSPIIYYGVVFIFSSVLFPLYLLTTIFVKRDQLIKINVARILKYRFEFKK